MLRRGLCLSVPTNLTFFPFPGILLALAAGLPAVGLSPDQTRRCATVLNRLTDALETIDRRQLLLISMGLFLCVCLWGCAALVLTGKVIPPGF